MKNSQAKQKAIQEGYAPYYGEFKPDLNTGVSYIKNTWDGDGLSSWVHKHCRIISTDEYGMTVIPKVIDGIYDNNSWVKIEPDGSNLPVEGRFIFITKHKSWIEIELTKTEPNVNWNKDGVYTHYRPVTEHPKPIY